MVHFARALHERRSASQCRGRDWRLPRRSHWRRLAWVAKKNPWERADASERPCRSDARQAGADRRRDRRDDQLSPRSTRRSNRAAQLFRARGLAIGDTVALLLRQHARIFTISTWGAQRAGLFYVCISSKLTAPEAAYIVAIRARRWSSPRPGWPTRRRAARAADRGCARASRSAAPSPAGSRWEDAVAAMPDTPIADERAGVDMLYSSGTTGRPKGVRVALPEDPDIAAPNVLTMLRAALYGIGPETIYLSPAPLYHAAPLRWSMTVQRLGGTVVMMQAFRSAGGAGGDRALSRHRQPMGADAFRAHAQAAPRRARGGTTCRRLKVAIHAAAPCPIPVKRRDDRLVGAGAVRILCRVGRQWPDHDQLGASGWRIPGSVGRAAYGTLHICDEAWRGACRPGERGAGLFRGRRPVRISQRSGKDRRGAQRAGLDDARRYRADR